MLLLSIAFALWASPAAAARLAAPTTLSAPSAPSAAAGRAAFFFNDHDAVAGYRDALSSFIRGQDSVLLEGVPRGRILDLFQAVSDGALDPDGAYRRLKRDEPMDLTVLQAVHGTGKTILPEPIRLGRNAKAHAREMKLKRQAAELIDDALDFFVNDGDAESALDPLERANAALAELHSLREKALLSDLRRRLARSPARIGVVFGAFHRWPYERLRSEGYRVSAVFYPKGSGLKAEYPYNRPLRRAKLGLRVPSRKAEERELLSAIVLHWLLGNRYRSVEFPEQKAAVYNAVVRRMRFGSIQRLARDLAAYSRRLGDDSGFDDSVSNYTLRWLFRKGFIKPGERRYFRLGVCPSNSLCPGGSQLTDGKA